MKIIIIMVVMVVGIDILVVGTVVIIVVINMVVVCCCHFYEVNWCSSTLDKSHKMLILGVCAPLITLCDAF